MKLGGEKLFQVDLEGRQHFGSDGLSCQEEAAQSVLRVHQSGVLFNLTTLGQHNPVFTHPRPGVDRRLVAVDARTGNGDFDDKFGRRRMTRRVIVSFSFDPSKVRLR